MKFAKLVRIESVEGVQCIPVHFPDNVPQSLVGEFILATHNFHVAQERIWEWVTRDSILQDDNLPCSDGLDESGHIIS